MRCSRQMFLLMVVISAVTAPWCARAATRTVQLITNIEEPCVSLLLPSAKLLIPRQRLQDIEMDAHAKEVIGKLFESATKEGDQFGCSITGQVDLSEENTRRFVASVLDS